MSGKPLAIDWDALEDAFTWCNPAERERWFAPECEGVREAAKEWLEENGIEASGHA